MQAGRGRTGAWTARGKIRRISTPKLICQNLPSPLGVRLHLFLWIQMLRMTTARKWLSWMQCRLACFALTRMHLRLQVKEQREPNLPRSKLLRRMLHRHLAEGWAEDGHAVATKKRAAPPSELSDTVEASDRRPKKKPFTHRVYWRAVYDG